MVLAAAAASGLPVHAARRRRRRRRGIFPSFSSPRSQTQQLASSSSSTAVRRCALQSQLHVLVLRSASGAALDAALTHAAAGGVGLYVCYSMSLYGEPSDCDLWLAERQADKMAEYDGYDGFSCAPW